MTKPRAVRVLCLGQVWDEGYPAAALYRLPPGCPSGYAPTGARGRQVDMLLWKKFRRLNAVERELVLEAAVLLVWIRVALHVLPFPTLRHRLDRRPPAPHRSVAEITWALSATARRLPGTTCLVEALTVHTMLRRHGHVPAMKLGVRDFGVSGAAAVSIDAHAWVECDGVVVAGTVDKLADYAVLS